jgi:ATP-dependent RNA circularization protein (DNA/RNA ligase family)
MKEYHKIQTVFKRDPSTNFKTLLENDYSLQEFDYLKNNVWVFTEKVDGTNIRVMYDGKDIAFGGKSDDAQIPAFLVKKLQERFLPQALKFTEKFGGEPINVCLYGEGYGAKIQKGGGNYRQDQDYVLFDVKIGDWWLQREDVEDIAKFFGLDIVPIIGEGTLTEMIEQTRKGFNSIWGNFLAEGIVARPKVELVARNGARLITKIKHKDFRSA